MVEQLVSTRESSEDGALCGLHRVKSPQLSLGDLETAIAELTESSRRRDLAALIRVLCRIVPEYQPSAALLELSTDSEIRDKPRMTRKIAVLTTSRADYSHLYWPLRDLAAHPEVDLRIIVLGIALVAGIRLHGPGD